ncbi:MAG TPA: hypothetical protein PKH10_09425, partial [bacterium]|nr:hypothetical protein [bacterium]
MDEFTWFNRRRHGMPGTEQYYAGNAPGGEGRYDLIKRKIGHDGGSRALFIGLRLPYCTSPL